MDTFSIIGLCTMGTLVIVLIGVILILCLPYGPEYESIRIGARTAGLYTFYAPFYITEFLITKLFALPK